MSKSLHFPMHEWSILFTDLKWPKEKDLSISSIPNYVLGQSFISFPN